MSTNTKTKTEKLLTLLNSGENVSVARIKARAGLSNPYSTITRLRAEGFQIYTNVKAGKTYYRLAV